MIPIELPKFTDIGREFAICFEACVETLCEYLHRDYQMMFLDQFKIHYHEGITDFNKDMAECYRSSDRYLEFLKEYHGIKLNYIDKGDFIEIITNELKKGKPVILHLNVFYCPWDVLYQKVHNCHMGIVTGMDQQYIYVCDPYDRVVHEKLLIEDAKEHSQFIYTYELTDTNLTKDVALELFKKEIKQEYHTSMSAFQKSYEFIMSHLTQFTGAEDEIFDLLFEFTKGMIIKYANFTYLMNYILEPTSDIYQQLNEQVNQNAKVLYRIKNLSMKLKISLNPVIVESINQFFLSFLENESRIYQLLIEL